MRSFCKSLPSQPRTVWQDLLYSTQEKAQNRFFYVFIAVYGWCKGFGEKLEDIFTRIVLRQFLAYSYVVMGDCKIGFLTELHYVVGD